MAGGFGAAKVCASADAAVSVGMVMVVYTLWKHELAAELAAALLLGVVRHR